MQDDRIGAAHIVFFTCIIHLCSHYLNTGIYSVMRDVPEMSLNDSETLGFSFKMNPCINSYIRGVLQTNVPVVHVKSLQSCLTLRPHGM